MAIGAHFEAFSSTSDGINAIVPLPIFCGTGSTLLSSQTGPPAEVETANAIGERAAIAAALIRCSFTGSPPAFNGFWVQIFYAAALCGGSLKLRWMDCSESFDPDYLTAQTHKEMLCAAIGTKRVF